MTPVRTCGGGVILAHSSMSDTSPTLRERLSHIREEHAALTDIYKKSFMAAPPMPAAGAPPMDPSMMQGGMMPPGAPPMDPAMMQGGAPPMDPAMMQGGAPMDPSMMGGAPPMDPAMMGGAPPMDPSMQGGAPPEGGGVPMTPEMLDQLLGVMEELGQGQEALGQEVESLKQENQELAAALEEQDQRLASVASTADPASGWR